MRGRALAIAAATLIVVLPLSAWGLFLGLSRPDEVPDDLGFTFDSLLFVLSQTAFALVGAVILMRRNDNRMGRLFCFVAVVATTINFSEQYAIQALIVDPGSLPGGRVMAWMTIAPGFTIMLAFASMVALYPDGRLPGRRWRPLLWLLAAGVVLAAIGSIASWPHRGAVLLRVQEVGIPGADLANLFLGATFAVSAIAVLTAIAAIAARYRRGLPLTKLQIKWFAYAAAIAVLGVFGTSFSEVRSGANLMTGIGAVGVPVAAGIAILRYRLYDIDRIINRSIVYGLLTAVLIGGYAGGVLLVQSVLPVESDSPIVVAATTLTMAALFSPLRRGIQAAVDRRFYRRKYDAIRTVENFSARLRDETDLEVLTDDLVEVVKTTMQPAQVSLWLRAQEAER